MTVQSLLATHTLPLWFLVLSLFLPRICIVIAWLQHSIPTYVPATVNLVQIIAAVLVPRILILFWIYQDQGIGLWFLIHAVALVFAWGGGGTRYARSRRVAVVD
ncbi:MAG: hypothetical protein ACRYFU_16930 [Janthinobacterium lividum]